jgi:hypothetical protein
VRRAAAKFAKFANLDPAGGLRFTRSADQWPSRPQKKTVSAGSNGSFEAAVQAGEMTGLRDGGMRTNDG